MTCPPEYCACETVAHGELGLIESHEMVARVVCAPRHVRKDGAIKPGVFPPSHIAKKGLSLMRRNHLSDDELRMHAEAISSHDEKDTAVGFIECAAEPIRSLVQVDGTRSVCLCDDPVKDDPVVPDNPAHALLTAAQPMPDENIIEIRRRLWSDLFSNLQRFP